MFVSGLFGEVGGGLVGIERCESCGLAVLLLSSPKLLFSLTSTRRAVKSGLN